MSRALSNLVARSLGAAQSFRPRTPSLFEPVHSVHVPAGPALRRPGSHGGPMEIEETGMAVDRGEVPAASQDSAAALPQVMREPQQAHPRHPDLDLHYARSYRVDSVLGNDAGQFATSPVREQVFLSHRAEMDAARLPLAMPLPNHDTRSREKSEAESLTMVPGPPKVNAMEAPAAPFADRIPAGRRAGEEDRQERPPQTFMPDRQERPVPGAPPFAPATRFFSRDYPQRSRDAEPVVHVTIGRIEIRAERETAVAARKNERAPVMGLEEYLRRKNTRGRE
jgi:hypothetical protein